MAANLFGRSLICKRKKQTLIILAVVILVFCFMQLLSLMRLNGFREKQGVEVQRVVVVKSELEKEEELKSTKTPESVYDTWRHTKSPRGVHSDDRHLYAPNKQNTFSCIHTRTVISMDQVNDDFCDCDDSSDEPGTSACPQSRFYCEYQIPHEEAQSIPGSRVNDGICDCCDGSDEWSGHMVPDIMRLSDDLQEKTVFHSPCSNQCKQILHNLDEEEKLRQEGNKLRKEYLELAEKLPTGMKKRYGPDGAFYKLSSQCYKYNTKEYEFTVCPFTSIKQQKSPEPSMSLGRNPSWDKQKPGDYVLLMLDGDAKLCPLGHSRKTKIHFFCGIEDKVTQVTENERCFYSIAFSSPAACS